MRLFKKIGAVLLANLMKSPKELTGAAPLFRVAARWQKVAEVAIAAHLVAGLKAS